MTFDRYGSIAAEIYDIDKPVDALPDTRFHLERLTGVSGPVLEPACGSGRTLLPLLRAGHEAAGFDRSEQMLARCRARRAAEGFAPALSCQRFEDFSYERRFGAIVVPLGSFALIDAFDAALAALRRFHAHLAPDGLLLIDVPGLDGLRADAPDQRDWTATDGSLLTCDGVRTCTDWLMQRAETRYRCERWRDGRMVETEIDVMALRFWSLEEMRMALAAAGFGEVTIIGNHYRRRPPRAGDRLLTFEARRP